MESALQSNEDVSADFLEKPVPSDSSDDDESLSQMELRYPIDEDDQVEEAPPHTPNDLMGLEGSKSANISSTIPLLGNSFVGVSQPYTPTYVSPSDKAAIASDSTPMQISSVRPPAEPEKPKAVSFPKNKPEEIAFLIDGPTVSYKWRVSLLAR